jgi:acyltransferase-like protein
MKQEIISQSPLLAAPASERRVDLDWVRISAFGLLIFYHVGMLYVSWEFHIKSAHRITELEPLMMVLNPWRLALLFLVSGAATRFMRGKLKASQLLRSRSLRLLPPLVFGMLVIVPPQSYLQILESVGYQGGFVDFYLKHYLAFGPQFCDPGPCLLLPTWNHLWFVAYLWVYTMILGAVLLVVPDLGLRFERGIAPMLSGGWLLVLPAAMMACYRLLLFPHFPQTHAMAGDWYNHAVYGTVFLLGFLLARTDGVWIAFQRLRWLALATAATLFVSGVVLREFDPSGQPAPLVVKIYAGTGYGCYQWFCIVAVLGFARRWLNRDSAARRYLTDAVFPYYIVHQTAIILIAHQLRGFGLPASIEATIVVVGTLASCAVTYEIVRRVRVLRPLFGLKPGLPYAPSGLPRLECDHPASHRGAPSDGGGMGSPGQSLVGSR